jgi:hypothetical protein
LNLDTKPESCDEINLQLACVRAFHWRFGKEKCFRLDRAPIAQESMAALKSALADAGAHSPYGEGWYRIEFPDRGVVQLRLARNQGDEFDTVVVILKPISESGVQLVHCLIIDCGFMLMPMAIAASESVAKEMNAPWPPVMVVKNRAELFSILARGPFAWWTSA